MGALNNTLMQFECVAQTLRRATRIVTRRYEDALRPLNLTASQYTLLSALTQRPALPQGLISDLLGFDPATMTRLLQPLKKRGLLKVWPDPDDARAKLVGLTESGRTLAATAKPMWQKAQTETISRLDQDEVQAMRHCLNLLSK
jgi:DNA-binding MarR family transcriptional regulator